MVAEEPLELKAAGAGADADADADAGPDDRGGEQIMPDPAPAVEGRTPPPTRGEARAAGEQLLSLLPQRSII